MNDNNLFSKNIETTIDAFHRGNFYIIQPKKNGHRCGLDAMLLSACVPQDFSGHLADFGSGAGAAGLAVASRCLQSKVTLIENSPIMHYYSEQTLALEQNKFLKDRIYNIQADLNSKIGDLITCGLKRDYFDFIIMNPPFNNPKDNRTKDKLRAQAHIMSENIFENWIKTAATLLHAKGKLALIAKPFAIMEILLAMHKRFGNIEITAVQNSVDQNAIRILLIAQHNSKGATIIKPPLLLRDKCANKFNEYTEKICNGLATL